MKQIKRVVLSSVFAFAFGLNTNAQTLTVQNSGDPGPISGTNWSITGNTLTVTGTASIQAAVLETALASDHLIVQGNTTNFALIINEDISVANGGNDLTIAADGNTGSMVFNNPLSLDGAMTAYGTNFSLSASLTTNGDVYIKAIGHIDQGSAANTVTNGGNLVFWSSSDGGTSGYIRTANITTNGGHIWLGGSQQEVSGPIVWNGLTVGAGYAASSIYVGVGLRGDISTSGGDVLIAGESGQSNYGDIEAESTDRTISTGSGDITLMPYSEQLQTPSVPNSLILQTTGKISVAPISGGSFWPLQTRTYNGSLSNGTFTGSSALAGIQIPNFANIGGWELGTYSGTGEVGDTPYVDANVKNMELTTGFTVAGPIRAKGDALWVRGNLETTANGASIQIKSDGPGTGNDEGWISLHADLTTNGGDIVLWSNASNRTSGTANNEIWFTGSRTLSSNGGKIVLAGGLDDGSNGGTANDGIPDGFAYRGGNSNDAIILNNDTKLLSGNGDIIIRGQHGSTGGASGVISEQQLLINSGTGTITMVGLSASGVGLGFDRLAGTPNIAITSASTQVPAITISGTTTSNDWAINLSNSSNSGNYLIQSTAATGGGVSITGVSNGNAGFHNRINSGRTQILSVSGDITISASSSSGSGGDFATRSQNGFYIGERYDATAVNGVTPVSGFTGNILLSSTAYLNSEDALYLRSSSSGGGDITIRVNGFADAMPTTGIVTSGNVVIEPYGNDFISGLTLNSGWSFNSEISSLRIGKEATSIDGTSDQMVTINSSITLAGPISVYGGGIDLNEDLASTSSGSAIKLIASGHIFIDAASGQLDLTTVNGDLLVSSNADATGGGQIRSLNGINASTGGGDITLAGGDALGTGYATGENSPYYEGIRFEGDHDYDSDGGNIVFRGKSAHITEGSGFGMSGIGMWNTTATWDVTSGTGSISLIGVSQAHNTTNGNNDEGLYLSGQIKMTSTKTTGTAITVIGDGQGTSLPTPNTNGVGDGILTDGNGVTFQATGGGDIEITGYATSEAQEAGQQNFEPFSPLNILATSGDIYLRGLSDVNYGTYLRSGGYLYLGAKTGSDVTSSSSNIIIEENSYYWPSTSQNPQINTTGTFAIKPVGTSFGHSVYSDHFTFGATPSGLQFGKDGNTAKIFLNSALTANGPILAIGGDMDVLDNLNTTGGAAQGDVTIKGAGDVYMAGNKSITTNGGDVTFWADSDEEGDGYIHLVVNASISTSGGAITLSGGSDLTTGFARGSSGYDKVTEPTFNLNIAGVHLMSGVNLSSGGGDVLIRGKNYNGSSQSMSFGVLGINTTINAGAGKVHVYGSASGSGSMNAQAVSHYTSNGWTISSASTASDAIYIEGDATGVNSAQTSIGINFLGSIEATGTGGGITIVGKSGVGTSVDLATGFNGDLLASSGSIQLVGENSPATQNGIHLGPTTIGFKAASNVLTSSSNVVLKADKYTFNNATVNSSGSLSVWSTDGSSSFGEALSFGSNITLHSSLGGLVIGKTTNDVDVTFTHAQSITGPITAYGNDISVEENLTTTGAAGDVLLKATGNVSISGSKTITTSTGDVVFWADSDDQGDGYVLMGASSEIQSSGGDVTLGGGADISTGYAKGAETQDTEAYILYISGVHLRNGTSINSGGGNITLRGQNAGDNQAVVQCGIMGYNTQLDAGSGKIALYGKATGTSSANAQGISSLPSNQTSGQNWLMRSSNTDSDAIYLSGDATATNNSYTSLGINFWGTIEATGTGGGVVMAGISGTSTNYGDGLNIFGDVLSSSGTIALYGSDDATNSNNRDVFIDGGTMGSKSATSVTSSSANVVIYGDRPAFASSSAVSTSGTFTLEPRSDAFASTLTYPITDLTLSSNVSGLTLGKSTNTSGVIFNSATSIAGPITVYGGTITTSANVTTSNGGAISFHTDVAPIWSNNPSISADGPFEWIPRSSSFTSDVTFTVAPVDVSISSNGLTIGKSGNMRNITFSGNYSTNGDIKLYGPTIDIANLTSATGSLTLEGSMTVDSANVLSVSKEIVNNGTITVSNGASLVQQSDNDNTPNSGSGSYAVKRRTGTLADDSRFQYWGSPVTSTSMGATFPGSATTDFYYYSPGTGWISQSSGANMTPGLGYITTGTVGISNASEQRTFNGQVNNKNVSVTTTANVGDYILLGNPYPSAIDADLFIQNQSNTITGTMYFWHHSTNPNTNGGQNFSSDYAAWNGSGSANSSDPTKVPEGYVGAMQGFFVKANTVNPALNFYNTQRVTGNNALFFKNDTRERVWLSLEASNGDRNQILVARIAEATDGFDSRYDGAKFQGNPDLAFYSLLNQEKMAIQALSQSAAEQTIGLGLNSTLTGEMTIHLDSTQLWDANRPIYLWDAMLNQTTDLQAMDYSFQWNFAGEINDRFFLIFGASTVGEEELTPEADSWYWYQTDNQLHIEGATAERITLRNTQGQMVAETVQKQRLTLTDVAQGVYTVEVQTNRGTMVKKVVIKN